MRTSCALVAALCLIGFPTVGMGQAPDAASPATPAPPQPSTAEAASAPQTPPIQCQVDLDSCKKHQALDEQSRQDLVKQLNILQEKLTYAEAANKELKLSLSRRDGAFHASLASSFDLVQRDWLSDRAAVFTFRLNRGSMLRVRLLDLPQRTVVHETNLDYGSTHHVQFSPLFADHSYEVEAVVLDWSGEPTSTIAKASGYPTSLSFRTAPALPVPALTVLPPVVTYNGVVLSFSSTSDLLLRVHCKELSSVSSLTTPCGDQGGSFGHDEAFKPTGGVPLASSAGLFKVAFPLKPATEYQIEWEAITQVTGESLPAPSPGFPKFTTPASPAPFDFANGFALTISPKNVEVSWSATLEPADARVELELGGESRQLTGAKKIEGTKVTVEVPTAGLQAMLPSGAQKREPLRIKAVMTSKDHQEKVASFAVAIEIPASASSKVSPDQREAVDDVRNVATKGKGKVTWDEIAKLGLPLLLNFI